MADESRALREVFDVLDDLDTLLKNPDVGADLTARGVNLSLAIVAINGANRLNIAFRTVPGSYQPAPRANH